MKTASLTCLALLATAAAARALVIQLDYTYDIANGGNFFGNNAAAKAALEKAAADLGAAIGPSLAAVPTDVFNGTSGSSTASINWSLSVDNPVTALEETQSTFSFAAETVTVFVGMRQLGSTLGVGGPGGVLTGFNAMAGTAASRTAAFNNAETASNATMPRGGGPVIGSFSGTFSSDPYTLAYGALNGSLSLDSDTAWHFDAFAPVVGGKSDFYSVALHELMHAIGFGTAETWDAQESGTTWTGTNAISVAGGSGSNLVTASGHIREGAMSFRLSDGVLAECVMDPTLTIGTRKTLTQLDLAFLRDLDYATVPEPSAAALLAAALVLAGLTRNRHSSDR